MQPNDFVHTHLHSEYSTLDGINKVEELPEYIKSLGMDAVSLTDHGNVAGSYKFIKACREAEVKPICGMEAYYTTHHRSIREKDELDEAYYHMILLAQNNVGLHNLFKLSSFAYTEGQYYKPRIDDELIGRYSEGIIATSACLGSSVSQLILRNLTREAEALLLRHAEMFKDRFFIELQLHAGEQQKVNQILIQIANQYKLPLIVTQDCHYQKPEDKQLHEIALCMQTNGKMSDEKRFSFGDIDVHVAPTDYMVRGCGYWDIPLEAITNTRGLANMVDSDSYFGNQVNCYPSFKDLPPGVTSHEALANLSKNMLQQRMQGTPPVEYRDRLAYELKVIKQMGFSDYMLVVWQMVEGARSEGVLVGPGRGSVAGSLVAYSLGISQVDPIKYGLLFERFQNVGRAATPLIFDKDLKDKIEQLGAASGKVTTRNHTH